MASAKHIKIKLREVNRHLVCRLCRGYYVDATTIAECLHSFCRSCIIKYLEKNSFCPICEVQIHKTKPYLSLRLDKALQDVVYKVVPGLYRNEMRRRREFYAKRQEQIPFATPEQYGVEERIIFAPEDSISLSLEYLESDDSESETISSRSSESGDNPDHLSFPQQLGLIKLKNVDGKISRRESQDVQKGSAFPKRYLQCPAVVNVRQLKKFIRMKHDLTNKGQVNIMHKTVPLPDHYTLMDVAYIYTWKRNSPLRFFYQIYQTKKHKIKVNPPSSETEDLKSQSATEQSKTVENEKVGSSEVIKLSSEVKTQAETNNDESEIIGSDKVKETVKIGESKSEDGDKQITEIKSEKSIEPVSNDNDKKETEEGFESVPKSEVSPRSSESDKLKPNGANATENKGKVETSKRKNGKVENNAENVLGAKENEMENRERLLLNPISGKLEAVPSPENCKTVNGTDNREIKKQNGDCTKKDVSVKGQKKSESKNPNVNLLKTFRKDKLKAGKNEKVEIKSRGSSLTITAIPKNQKLQEKETGNFSVEIKADKKASEYDFDGSSSPSKIIPLQKFSKYSKFSKYIQEHRDKWLSKESKNNWMPLKDFREKILKENDSSEADAFVKNKNKMVPSLYKINSDINKTVRKTPNGKLSNEKVKESKTTPAAINLKTEKEVSKSGKVKGDVVRSKTSSSLQVTKVEINDKECGEKPPDEKTSNTANCSDIKSNSEPQKQEKIKGESETEAKPSKTCDGGQAENETPKSSRSIKNLNEKKNESLEAMDLSKAETSVKPEKNPLENLMDLANKTGSPKGDEKTGEANQKQTIEPFLKIPQYSQMLKNSMSLGTISPGKNISSNEISQALQFLEDLRSDIKVFESKNKLNPSSVLEQFAQKSGALEPYQQLYQQKIDLIRRLKRQNQIVPNECDTSPKKQMKLSPTSESKKRTSSSPEQNTKLSLTSDEISQYKSSVERTLTQIQLMELQSRMLVARNYKNLPALLQYYSRPPNFSSGSTPPSKSNQQRTKTSQSPKKSPQSLSSPENAPHSASGSDSSFFNHQNYGHLINSGLNSEMTYHQMFQTYLNQQEQMNQVKLPQASKKQVQLNEASPSSTLDKYCSPPSSAKKQELNNSLPSAQKS